MCSNVYKQNTVWVDIYLGLYKNKLWNIYTVYWLKYIQQISNVVCRGSFMFNDFRFGWFMVFNATFNNMSVISWQKVLLAGKETRVPRESHRPAVSHHWQTLSHNVVIEYTSTEAEFTLTTLVVIDTDCIGSCKFNYHTITTTTAPQWFEVRGDWSSLSSMFKLFFIAEWCESGKR